VSDAAQDIDARHPRQLDVEKNEVGPHFVYHADRGNSVRGLTDALNPLYVLQELAQPFAGYTFILDDESSGLHPIALSRAAGREVACLSALKDVTAAPERAGSDNRTENPDLGSLLVSKVFSLG
jgi:hypothetical protein